MMTVNSYEWFTKRRATACSSPRSSSPSTAIYIRTPSGKPARLRHDSSPWASIFSPSSLVHSMVPGDQSYDWLLDQRRGKADQRLKFLVYAFCFFGSPCICNLSIPQPAGILSSRGANSNSSNRAGTLPEKDIRDEYDSSSISDIGACHVNTLSRTALPLPFWK
jgi:hypothetical protein